MIYTTSGQLAQSRTRSYVQKLAVRKTRTCLLFCQSKKRKWWWTCHCPVEWSSWNLYLLIGTFKLLKFIINFSYFWNLISCFLFIIHTYCFYLSLLLTSIDKFCFVSLKVLCSTLIFLVIHNILRLIVIFSPKQPLKFVNFYLPLQ